MRDKESIAFILPSDPAFIHQVIREAQAFLQEYGIKDTTKISVVLRELLSNAIAHGNRNVAALAVNCRLERTGEGQFMIVVEDEGEGFDFASLDTSLPDDPRNIRNRGYVLIRNICSELGFNERGNQVTVLIDAPETNWGKEKTDEARSAMRRRATEPSARYGIDIRGYRFHGEARDLEAVLSTLDGVEGSVSVIDRQTKDEVFCGTAGEVRAMLLRALASENRSERHVDAGS
jgi:anti-sigma regulatory factor (Ser/Thr protein kinase)